jgi:hypothetical protein
MFLGYRRLSRRLSVSGQDEYLPKRLNRVEGRRRIGVIRDQPDEFDPTILVRGDRPFVSGTGALFP